MARVKRGVPSRAYHKKILKMAKGYRGRNHSCFRIAKPRVVKGLQYAYRDRKVKKRFFRSMWIMRINAFVRERGITYSVFMNKLKKAGILLNRKVLADFASGNPSVMSTIFERVKDVK